MSGRLNRIILCLLLFVLVENIFAGTNTIDFSTIDGGGGTSTGNLYSLSGTIGQPDAGRMSSNNFVLEGGFWGFFAIQTLDAPLLTISRSGVNAIVSWPLPALDYVLQQSTNIVNTNGWSDFSGTINSNATTFNATVEPEVHYKFFRLKK
jgi:hypothetical protein